MPWGLKRYYNTGSLHFITWSCYRRKPLLSSPARRDLLLSVLELMRIRYRFAVIGYVVMPDHVHLLISEPLIGDPSKIIQAVKLSVHRRLAIAGEFSAGGPQLLILQALPTQWVQEPEQWLWSSYRICASDEVGMVKLNLWPKAELRQRPAA